MSHEQQNRPARARAIAWRNLRAAARELAACEQIAEASPSVRNELALTDAERKLRAEARLFTTVWSKEAA